jgi:glycosyltransferase involved in cell wall biosynthesis
MYLILIPDLRRLGGAERIALGLVRHLQEKGHKCEIATLYYSPLVKDEFIFDVSNGIVKALFKAKRCIRKYNVKIINAHLKKGILFARILKLFLNIKLISSFHNSNQGGLLNGALLLSLSRNLDDMATNVSHYALEYCAKKKFYKRSNSKVILNGVDTKKFKFSSQKYHRFRKVMKIQSHEIILIAVGHLTEQKGHDILIEAMVGLEHKKNWRLIILGEGYLRAELENILSKNENIRKRVKLVGDRKNVLLYYNICDAVIMPSRWEGFGLVAAEALACERELVISNCDGLGEVFADLAFTAKVAHVSDLRSKISEMMLKLEKAQLPIHRSLAREFIVENLSQITMYDAYESAIRSFEAE